MCNKQNVLDLVNDTWRLEEIQYIDVHEFIELLGLV